MPADDSNAHDQQATPGNPIEQLSSSARGWHTIQVAVLGFIGICGVLRTTSTSTPRAVQVLAALLAIASLAVACVAIFLVGRVAYPFNAPSDTSQRASEVAQARQDLQTGIWLTVLALILIVIAALSGWWPKT